MNRKDLKQKAKLTLKNNYFKSILVIFIAGLIINGGYNYTTNIYSSETNNSSNYITQKSNFDLINEIYKNISKKSINKEKEKRVNGVLAPIVNSVTESKSFALGILNSFNLLVFKKKINSAIISFIAVLVFLIYHIFVQNVIIIGNNRFFLENRKYKNTNLDKLLFPYKVKKYKNIAYIMLMMGIYLVLWSFTIVGFFIKYYSYHMVPYILAENPSIKRKEAFRLSKEMMKGYKWKTFVLDLSFIGWHILSILTFGLINIFYLDAYKENVYAELYMKIRNEKKKDLTDGDLLSDDLLDIKDEVDDEYPMEKYILPVKINKNKKKRGKYLDTKYSITTYIMFFFTFAFIGWSWEVMLHLITDGTFVNRGTMFGPWLPIYGFGGILILLLLKPFREKPALFFISAMVLAGIVEYSTAWYLETFKGMKWWDYTGYFLNLHGRICLEGLLVFGLGGAVVTYFVGPMLNDLYLKIAPKVRIVICSVLVLLFGADAVYSSIHPNTGDGVTNSADI